MMTQIASSYARECKLAVTSQALLIGFSAMLWRCMLGSAPREGELIHSPLLSPAGFTAPGASRSRDLSTPLE
jgi:hypothetical protein